jgi:3-oxoadipate enol-lactonase
MPTLAVPGALLNYHDDGAGPAIVLVHGWALDASMWEPQTAALRASHRVVRHDRRGFGASTGMPDAEHDIADLLALFDALGIQRATLVGMSQGARVVMSFAARHPRRVARLVVDGAPPDTPELPLAQLRDTLDRRGIEAVRTQLLAQPLMRLQRNDADTQRRLRSMIDAYRGIDLQATAPAGQRPVAAPAPVLQCPVLILTGEFDTAARLEQAERLHQAVVGSTRRVIPGAGHLAALDNPAAYTTALLEFIGPATS